MSIVLHLSGNGSRELAQLLSTKRQIRRQSSLDPFALLTKPVEWFTNGFIWLLEWFVKYLMRQVGYLGLLVLVSAQDFALLLVLLKEHWSTRA